MNIYGCIYGDSANSDLLKQEETRWGLRKLSSALIVAQHADVLKVAHHSCELRRSHRATGPWRTHTWGSSGWNNVQKTTRASCQSKPTFILTRSSLLARKNVQTGTFWQSCVNWFVLSVKNQLIEEYPWSDPQLKECFDDSVSSPNPLLAWWWVKLVNYRF